MNHNFFNLIMTVVLSISVIFGWQYFYDKPRLKKLASEKNQYNEKLASIKKQNAAQISNNIVDRSKAIKNNSRIIIKSQKIIGSISLKGLRFDDISLTHYKQTVDTNSEPVDLFSPVNSKDAYFAEIGWISNDKNITYPNSTTIWKADKTQLEVNDIVHLYWINPEKVKFKLSITLDQDYLFTIIQTTENHSRKPISTRYYGLINRNYEPNSSQAINILHQGMIGSINQELTEYSYSNLKEKKQQSFNKSQIDWLGITDKYWCSAFIPDQSEQYTANYNFAIQDGIDKYQADFLSSVHLIDAGNSFSLTHHLFAGPKKVALLDHYKNKYNIALFDRAIDFGALYILTKPIFNAMNFFYKYVGNFGISIMIVTILVKLSMFTLANKSYRSMKKMKTLQPKMERLKELYSDDKARLNQEIMTLYKTEKVNPVSGCLPLLIQIPVFFAIYKVLYVTIEMRHAPFFGWIHDLSSCDPTSIFNLFGLLPFTPPSFLMIGVWPIIMAMSMFLQQKMSPAPTDPVQAQVMKFMPLMFLFMFSSFPAGLLIYWSWNNILSIAQQYYIIKLDKD